MQNDYYWSDEWSEEFYIELAKAGFISTSHDTKAGLVLLPELQNDYAILDFENLHISNKVKKLLARNRYELSFNKRFNEVIKRFPSEYDHNWLKEEYAELLTKLYLNSDKYENFKIVSVELVCKESSKLVAGEIGYIISDTYTSLSGFSSKEKRHTNSGTLQLVLLAQHLQKNSFRFWNFGHPHMQYKKRLGCKTYTRAEFLKRWLSATSPHTSIATKL